ncbi:putative P-loop containing nucleoside triphosphate hydrolase, leucine-rich repeat domain, L [Rosa chinensis]|uniref:Putative P-loop containing nucleoside triphosphate hydrolase, leucine-rich repeat domain, L n=1 Tax=Rosa chinensis TaxID=74649 RepID=A0A2P6RW11_ROSCH|nr:putative P-loop containing nucleoside triphosphate hydrolase, leucine-rich repeat domain, L [Rosa chinensis]
MVSAAQDLLLGKIVAILENEASSIVGVRDKVDDIKQELVSMKAFLKDAEGKKAQTEGGEAWITSVRDSVYDVEDTIDEFTYRIYELKYEVPVARCLHVTFYIPKNLWYRRQIAKKLDKIKGTIKAISERNQTYGVSVVTALEGTSTSHDYIQKLMSNQAEASLFTNEDELVGIEAPKKVLIKHIVNGQLSQAIVSAVGMGGSGKTTLVAKIFNNDIVKRHFNCYAWVTVSQTYVIEDLFRSLIKQFHEARKEEVPREINMMSFRELVEILVNYLNSKRYLVVLDDVWDINLWTQIRVSLQDRQLGSRVVLTTRNNDIASYAFGVASHVHHIQPLGKKDTWELFCKKTFSTHPNKSCPLELEPLAREFVGKCNGLPLAIVALGGLMSSKTSCSEWSDVCNSLNWHLTNHPLLGYMKSILLLSFNDLSYRLKHCFLYCSLFPEDYQMKRKRLIRLWIAEGFVEYVKGVTPEVVADGYLLELCFRSMLQVVVRNEAGRPKKCKMHDVMRELALSTSEIEKFCAVYDRKDEAIEARRLSIQLEGEIKSSTETTLPSNCKFLRVLDLENVSITKLPDDVGYLFNLRYLNLRRTHVKELPKWIGKLRNLLTLNIRESMIEELPKEIAKLLNLRHLIMYRYTDDFLGFRFVKGIRVPVDVSQLNKLQVLSCVEAEGDTIRQVGCMTQLIRIGITNVKESDEMHLCDSIQKLLLLHYLFLMSSDEEEILRTNALCSPPPLLRVVILVGRLENVPLWFHSLWSLAHLYLHWSKLEENLVPHIEALPNLGYLTLVNAYVGKQLYFRRGFVKLKKLELYNHPLLTKITIENGVMPNLHDLHVESCMSLKTLPLGLEYLANLQKLTLETVPKKIILPIRKGAVDRRKVQHIPEILYFYEESSMRFYEILS